VAQTFNLRQPALSEREANQRAEYLITSRWLSLLVPKKRNSFCGVAQTGRPPARPAAGGWPFPLS